MRRTRGLRFAALGALALGTLAALAAAPAPAPMAAADASAAPAKSVRLSVARLQYDGDDWYANPSSLPNLIRAIRARTTLDVEPQEQRVRLTDEKLWDHPFLHLTGHGQIRFSDREVERLRAYLLQGGFLHADDNYGLDAAFRREIARVFPDRELVDVPLDHPIYRIVYAFPQGVPKIHEHDGAAPRGFGIFIGDRLAVYYTHEADLGNGWEDVGTYPDDPPELHEQALRMGVNLFVYAVTSGVGR
ncbi:MAG: DUF4159 domain-containing protein [Gemmatimonadaceae bacterium]|nr:DUF4159 domain-containing protein [Gemmatimonadaceae bacterium]MCW5827383.1 DUF4159 domain-containing protein [Gemmatimonadaceae bacterium]